MYYVWYWCYGDLFVAAVFNGEHAFRTMEGLLNVNYNVWVEFDKSKRRHYV